MTSLNETAAKARRGRIHWLAAWSGVTVVGGAALMTLAYYQHRFGVDHAKMPSLLAWTFSIGLDWGGAIASIFWFLGDGKMARWGRGSAITLLVGSTALTSISFGTIAGWPYAALGAIPSAVAFVMAKLLMLWPADRAERRGQADALDAYRADLDRHRSRLIGYHRVLDEAAVYALAAVWADRAVLAGERSALDAEREDLARDRATLQLEQAKLEGALAGVGSGKRARRPVAPAGRRAPQQQPAPPQLQSADALHRKAVVFLRANVKADGKLPGRYALADHLGISRDGEVRSIHDAAKAEIQAGRDERTGTD